MKKIIKRWMEVEKLNINRYCQITITISRRYYQKNRFKEEKNKLDENKNWDKNNADEDDIWDL